MACDTYVLSLSLSLGLSICVYLSLDVMGLGYYNISVCLSSFFPRTCDLRMGMDPSLSLLMEIPLPIN